MLLSQLALKNKVSNVSLQIENKGDIICLLGPSGIGKTTISENYCRFRKNTVWVKLF